MVYCLNIFLVLRIARFWRSLISMNQNMLQRGVNKLYMTFDFYSVERKSNIMHSLLTLLCIRSIFTLINNCQNLAIQKSIGSRPDPFRAGAYNLQSISTLQRNWVWFTRLHYYSTWNVYLLEIHNKYVHNIN